MGMFLLDGKRLLRSIWLNQIDMTMCKVKQSQLMTKVWFLSVDSLELIINVNE